MAIGLRERASVAFCIAALAVTGLVPSLAGANPIVWPPEARPAPLSYLAMAAPFLVLEAVLLVALFARRELSRARFFGLVLLMNFATWTWMLSRFESLNYFVRMMVLPYEVAIVGIEAAGLYLVGRVSASRPAGRPISALQALGASLLVNAASVFASLVLQRPLWTS